jgi:murein hydrolase activator
MIRRIYFVGLFLFLQMNGVWAQKDIRQQLQNQRTLLQKELAALTKKVELTHDHIRQGTKQRVEIKQQIKRLQQQVETLDLQLLHINTGLKRTDAGLTGLYERLTQLKKSYSATLALSWKLMNQMQVVQVVFSPEKVQEEMQREQYIKMLRVLQLKQANEIRGLQQQYKERKHQLGREQATTNSRLQTQISVSEKLVVQERAVASEVQQLENKKKQWQALVAKKSRQQKTIENRLKALVSRSKAPSVKPFVVSGSGKGRSGKSALTKPEMVRGNNLFRLNKGRMPCPVNGRIIMHFGMAMITPVRIQNDFLTFQTDAAGTPVSVVCDGEVLSVSKEEETIFVIVSHGGIYTVYGNLGSAAVEKGQFVKTGAVIGTVAAGFETSKGEFEFGIFENRKFINPEPWINCQ